MYAFLNIEIDNQIVGNKKTPSYSLSKNLFHSAEMWGITDPRLNVLAQRRVSFENACWKYTFLVKQKVKLHFHQLVQTMFGFNENTEEELKLKLGKQTPRLLRLKYNLL